MERELCELMTMDKDIMTRKEIRESKCYAQSAEAKREHDNKQFIPLDKAREKILSLPKYSSRSEIIQALGLGLSKVRK